MKIQGKISHYPHGDKVEFTFQKIDPKKKNDDSSRVVEFSSNLLFDIWKRFKNSEIVITIEKAK